jgi:8-oxo-dGTP diphosphatase
MNNILPAKIYYQRLPRKVCSAGALFFNERGQLLLVKPTYRAGWLVPGGSVEADEAPRLACIREVQEEIGLDIASVTPLCIDYLSGEGERPESLTFLFYGKVLDESEIGRIVLPLNELSEFRFVDLAELDAYVSERMTRRIPYCLSAWEQRKTIYLENGRSVDDL